MGVILNGAGIGFFVAVFFAVYANGFFQQQIPILLIYGIIGPFIAAIIVFLLMMYDKQERTKAEIPFWIKEKENRKFAPRN